MKSLMIFSSSVLLSMALAAGPTQSSAGGDKTPESQGKVEITVKFQNPVKDQALNGTITKRGARIEIFASSSSKDVSGGRSSGLSVSSQRVVEGKIDTQTGKYSVALDPGAYRVECTADLPMGIAGTSPKRKKEFTVTAGKVTTVNLQFP